MTKNRTFKNTVRKRMAETGEAYTVARRAIITDRGADHRAPAAQLERYIALGYPRHAGMTDDAFRSWLAPLVRDGVPEAFDSQTGAIGTLLVIRQRIVNADTAMESLVVRGNPGYVDMNPSHPNAFNEIETVDTPDADAYLVHDFDPGDDLRNEPPSAAMSRIVDAGRSPITIDEALAAAVLYPQLVTDKHAFSILASRSNTDPVTESVPALWISRGAPRLGWCWNNNPHTWLGSASCSGRSNG